MVPVHKHKRNLEDLLADGWIICTDKMHLKERGWEGAAQIHFAQDRGPVAGTFEQSNKF
jgi:hypothetical protein